MSRHIVHDASLLDRPVWAALTTRLKGFRHSIGHAHRMVPECGPFAACRGLTTKDEIDFAALVARNEAPIATMDAGSRPIRGVATLSVADGVQMVADRIDAPTDQLDFVTLAEKDEEEIYWLAQLCKPGPFARNTARLGTFIGLRREGALIGMAGQRLQLPGFTEISGVSVAPEFRGQGLGGELVRAMAKLIEAEGDTPFLHAYASNTAAIKLYTRLGFRLRTNVQLRQYAPLSHAAAA